MTSARQLTLLILRDIERRDSYTDVALDRHLKTVDFPRQERGLVTELVYGIVRRQRTLDRLIEQFSQKSLTQQPPDLRRILQIGLYQLRYLDHIPPSAAVHTSVELAKQNGLRGLAGVINGILRNYLRQGAAGQDPLKLPDDPVARIGIAQSLPDWIVSLFLAQWGETVTEQLAAYFNQTPTLDIRINPLKTTRDEVETMLNQAQVVTQRLPYFPQALRLLEIPLPIPQLPGFEQGYWTVQDASAQLVGHLLDPQPGEVIIDACAAPGGKTTHLAELMQDQGQIYACDRTVSRLRKVRQSQARLQLQSIQTWEGDSRCFPLGEVVGQLADRVLVDVPCSGLGTLHRNPDLRWRQTPEKIAGLIQQQQDLLTQTATWVKPQGYLVYATCTLNPAENQAVITQFLAQNPQWQIEVPDFPLGGQAWSPSGWLQILPQEQAMDGFFMVKLRRIEG